MKNFVKGLEFFQLVAAIAEEEGISLANSQLFHLYCLKIRTNPTYISLASTCMGNFRLSKAQEHSQS